MGEANFAGNIVMDMDDVIVNISPSIYECIRCNWKKYRKYLEDLGPLTRQEIFKRKQFDMFDWLVKEKYDDDIGEKKDEAKKQVMKWLKQDFFNTDYYSSLYPTELAIKTLMNKTFMSSNRIQKVFILTRYFEDCPEMLESKKKFIERYFKNEKVVFIPIKSFEIKANVLKNKGITWQLLIDDEPTNILDFIMYYPEKGHEYLVPEYGYSKLGATVENIIIAQGGSINYYNRVE